MKVSVIVAMGKNRAIGKDNQLLWHLPADLKYFRGLTTGHHIVMGRKTYESIGKPLPNRVSVIITRNEDFKAEGCIVVNSLEKALEYCKQNNETEAFVIGGGEIYNMASEVADLFYITEVDASLEADVFFPELKEKSFKEIFREKHTVDEKHVYNYDFVTLERIK